MSTRTEHIARLTEMSVRAQAIADELASQDDAPMADDLAKKDAHVERLLTDIRGLVQRAEAAERELADLKARAVVLPDDWREQLSNLAASRIKDEDDARELLDSWRAEPASREPDGAVMDARQADKAPCGDTSCDCASREPEAPGFYIGDQVWHMPAGERGTVYATRDDARLCSVAFDSGQRRVWESDLRHVYDADHEPPQGVNVVRDMGVPADDNDGAYLCRTFDNKWRWEDGPTHDQFGAGGGSWALRIDDVDGPLVEHRPGDAA